MAAADERRTNGAKKMIVIQQSFIPNHLGPGGLLHELRRLRSAWATVNGAETAGRILVPYSGLPRQAIWEQYSENLAAHDERRRAWERDAKTQTILSEIGKGTSDSQHRVFTVVGDDDVNCPFRTTGVLVQALYTPAHGKRARALELLRQWQREWAKPQLPAMKGRVLGFFSTGQTHDLIWQAEFESAAEYDRLYRQWSDSPAFDDWARDFRDAIVSNVHSILSIIE